MTAVPSDTSICILPLPNIKFQGGTIDYQYVLSQHGAFDIGQDTHDGFVPQNIPQGLAHFPTDLNPTRFEPSMSQDQSSSSALGAYCPNDPDSLYSEDYIATLGQKRPSYRKVSHPYKGVPFVRSDTPPPSALSQSTRKTSTLQVESAVIDRVKEDASRFLNLSLSRTLWQWRG
ncbi:uncharacterized protein F5891DRAFT_1191499 [Suillus fuscotomentosus]|uniref:Uncharacterized protein n=1 Tax=Suillus fuscotomentosus TaxID=1912939 RepID=A0AAD4E200_9AGAM|nr:uncharacterized protein F5891DRAFT_1191499 [Suillus fuscotomentosus]KAG1897872.1 hypothetical protein F5891DRAFT_1191499 [Suillus fuscotomentosus]